MAEGESAFSFVKEGEYELILGNSLSNNRKEQEHGFHTVRYDFKPASIDSTKPGSLIVGDKHNVTVEVPHIQDSGSTIYNGSKRQCQKEFLLIIDKKTQTFTLERIGSNMQVKKIRSSGSSKGAKAQPTSSTSKATPEIKTKNIKSKSPTIKEPVPAVPSSSQETNNTEEQDSDSSSSSDNSSVDSEDDNKNVDDDDEDDDDDDIDDKHVEQLNNILNSLGSEPYKKPPEFNQLSQDLHLSESGSDSDSD